MSTNIPILFTLVVDTSSFLSELNILKELVKKADWASLEILIPITVIHELDLIKDRERLTPLGIEARKAIDLIYDTLESQGPHDYQRMRGQTKSEQLNPSLKADQSILDCAMFNKENTDRLTVLVSRDKNLLVMAKIKGLQTIHFKNLGMTVNEMVELFKNDWEHKMDYELTNEDLVAPKDDELDVEMDYGELRRGIYSNTSDPINHINESKLKNLIEPEFEYDMDFEVQKEQLEYKKMQHKSQLELEDQCQRVNTHEQVSDVYSEIPQPLPGSDLEDKLVKNISSLMTWHLLKIYDKDILSSWYKPPTSPMDIAKAVSLFKVDFEQLCGQRLTNDFIKKVEEDIIDENYVFLHVQMLRKLSYSSPNYEKLLH